MAALSEKPIAGIPPLSEVAPEPGKCGAIVVLRDRDGTRQPIRNEDGAKIFSHYCKARPVKGTERCVKHGSGNRASKEAGLARVEKASVEREALAAVKRWGLSEVHYQDAILEELRRTHAVVLYLDGLVSDPLFTDVEEGSVARASSLNVLTQWWQSERNHLSQVVALVHKMGIDERAIAVQEGQARILASVIKGVLDSLSLSAEQKALAPQVVRAQLMLASGGAQ